MPDEDDERGFKVEDKRRFDATGQPREQDEQRDQDTMASEPPTQEDSPLRGPAGQSPGEPSSTRESEPGAGDAELSFSSFVVGLASQAFMFLGATPDPSSGVVHKDLAQAAAMIDILSILQEKTVGNLTEDETQLIVEVLYELRMRYVSETQHGGAGQAGGQGETNEG